MDEIVDTEQPDLDPQRTYQWLAAGAMVLVGFGTVVFRLLEDWSWVDAFYFSVVAVTTVGFGDLSPTRDASKLFSVLYIVVGITIIGAYLDARFKKHAGRRVRRRH